MHIVEPKVELLFVTPDAEKMIERAGRTCYKSEDKITSDSSAKFVKMLRDKGHHAMLEHAYATLLWITDRGVTHELVRHRIASYAQESTRYCKYDDIAVIKPVLTTATEEDIWYKAMLACEAAYGALRELGVAAQHARDVLPTCLKTEIVVTANFREWRHITKLRSSASAHPKIQFLAKESLNILMKHAPNVFGDLTEHGPDVPGGLTW